MKMRLKVLAVGAFLSILPALSAPASAECYYTENIGFETEQRCAGYCASQGCATYEYVPYDVCYCIPYGWHFPPGGGESAQAFMTPASPAEAATTPVSTCH